MLAFIGGIVVIFCIISVVLGEVCKKKESTKSQERVYEYDKPFVESHERDAQGVDSFCKGCPYKKIYDENIINRGR